MRKFAIYFLFLCLIPGPAGAAPVDLVLIEKSARTLRLMSGKTVVHEYTVSLGTSPVGPKRCQGDGKTPEGDYIISGRNKASQFHRSLRVSYPNTEDRRLASQLKCDPGGDIMIHGLPDSTAWLGSAHRLYDWTLGCIAITNDEIEEVWGLVKDGTKVRIVP